MYILFSEIFIGASFDVGIVLSRENSDVGKCISEGNRRISDIGKLFSDIIRNISDIGNSSGEGNQDNSDIGNSSGEGISGSGGNALCRINFVFCQKDLPITALVPVYTAFMTPFREYILIDGTKYAKVKPTEDGDESGEMNWSKFKLAVVVGLVLVLCALLGPAVSALLSANIPLENRPEWLKMIMKALMEGSLSWFGIFIVIVPYYLKASRVPVAKNQWFKCAVALKIDGIEYESFQGKMRVSSNLIEFESKNCCFQFGADSIASRDASHDRVQLILRGAGSLVKQEIIISDLPVVAGISVSDLMWALKPSSEIETILPPVTTRIKPYTSWGTLIVWHGILYVFAIIYFTGYISLRSGGKSPGLFLQEIPTLWFWLLLFTGLVYIVRLRQVRRHDKLRKFLCSDSVTA